MARLGWRRSLGLVLAMLFLLAPAAGLAEEEPALSPAEAVSRINALEPALEKHRLALEYPEALEKLQRVARACPAPSVQRYVSIRSDPLSREYGLLLRLIEEGTAGRDLVLPGSTVPLLPVGVEGYRLLGSPGVRPWRLLRAETYLGLLDQVELTAPQRLDVAVFGFHRGLDEQGYRAIRTAREMDLELKAAADRLIADHRDEAIPRGGYELFRGRYVPLARRDVGVVLVRVAEELRRGDLTAEETRLEADLRLAIERLSMEEAPALLTALAERLAKSLRAREALARDSIASFRGERLAAQRLDLLSRIDAIRGEALALIAGYEKPQQPEVDAYRRNLTDLWGEAEGLRRHDERKLLALSPAEAWAIVVGMEMRADALDRIHGYLALRAGESPRPPKLAAVDPDRATLRVLPGSPYRGLEEAFWLALNERAGRRVYLLERAIEIRRRLAGLRPWERMVIRDVLDRNIRGFNLLVATSLGPAERACIGVINDYREILGRRPLEVDERLVQAARGHSQEMVDLGYFGHTSPVARNRNPNDRVRNAGYSGGAGENCAAGSPDAGAVFEMWYHSPGHHRGMIAGAPHTGIGHDRGGSTWTLLVGGNDTTWRLSHVDLSPGDRARLAEDIDLAVRGVSEARASVLARGKAALGPVARSALGLAKHRVEDLGPIELLIALAQKERNVTLLRAAVDALIPFLDSARRELRDAAFLLVRDLVPWKLRYSPGMPARERQRALARLLARVEKERESIVPTRDRADRPERPRVTSKPPSIETPLRPLTRQDRLKLARKHGGSARTEQAVERGLKWLARHQCENGSFGGKRSLAACRATPSCPGAGSHDHEIGLTGLSLLAFLAAGNTPELGDYAAEVRAGVDYLMFALQDSGRFATTSGAYMYSHSLATQALLEAYAYTADPEIGRAARRALDYLVYSQNGPSGGWRYDPKQAADTSVTGWVVLCLHAARKAGFETVGSAGVRRWIRSVTSPGYYHVGYQKPRDQPPNKNRLGAVGMVIRQVLGTKRSSPYLTMPAARLAADLPDAARPDPYTWYYGTLAMFQMGGESWQAWNRALVRALLETQETTERRCVLGSWAPRGEFTGQGGRPYTTALLVLTLTVYYRYDVFPESRPDAFTGSIDDLLEPHLERLGDGANEIGREVAKRIIEEKFGHGAAPRLIRELETAPGGARRDDLAEVLSNVATDEHVPAILRLMAASEGKPLEHLSRALARAATARNLDALIVNLRHGNRFVRGHSAMALGGVGDEAALPALLALQAEERDGWVRSVVDVSIRNVVHRQALDRFLDGMSGLTGRGRSDLRDALRVLQECGVLEELWRRGETSKRVREEVTDLIETEGRAAFIPILFLGLRSPELPARKDAIRLLRSLTGQDHGFRPNGPEAVRREAIARWEEWWRVSRPDAFREAGR